MIEAPPLTQTTSEPPPQGWRVEHAAPELQDFQVERLVKLAVHGQQAFALKAAADAILGARGALKEILTRDYFA